jgi:hypothetical protein
VAEPCLAPPSPCPDCRHRIITIADIGSATATGEPEAGDTSPGINNLGQACGIYNSASLGNLRAFAWLPRAQFGLASGLHDLNSLAGLTGFTFAMGMDLNDNAYVVGINGSIASMFDDGHAWLWKVSDYTTSGGLPYLDLHTTGSGSDSDSCAYAINNASPAIVVGFADFVCDLTDLLPRGFFRDTSVLSAMAELLPGAGSAFSAAFDLRTATPVWIVGRDDLASTGMACIPFIDAPHCYFMRRDPVVWQNFSSTATLLSRPNPPAGAQVRAINSQGKMVGVTWVQPPSGNCPRLAFLWDGLSQTVTLSMFMPPLQTGNNCWAEGISDPDAGGRIFIGGFNATLVTGIIWEKRTDADYCAIDPNQTTLPCNTTFVIEKVFDLNKFGHAIIHGRTGTQRQVGILTCRADLNGDLRISHSDELILDNQMGCTGPNCSADLNCDEVVHEDDLRILVATASGANLCLIERLCTPGGGGAGAFAGGGGSLSLEEALWTIGFEGADHWIDWSSTASEDEWNSYAVILAALLAEY